MTYSFFLDQLQSTREKFTLEPEIFVFSGGAHHLVNQVKYKTYDGNRIVIDFGGSDIDWEDRCKDLESEVKELERNLSVFENDLVKKIDEIEELTDEIENLKEEKAELSSRIEELEDEGCDTLANSEKLKRILDFIQNETKD